MVASRNPRDASHRSQLRMEGGRLLFSKPPPPPPGDRNHCARSRYCRRCHRAGDEKRCRRRRCRSRHRRASPHPFLEGGGCGAAGTPRTAGWRGRTFPRLAAVAAAEDSADLEKRRRQRPCDRRRPKTEQRRRRRRLTPSNRRPSRGGGNRHRCHRQGTDRSQPRGHRESTGRQSHASDPVPARRPTTALRHSYRCRHRCLGCCCPRPLGRSPCRRFLQSRYPSLVARRTSRGRTAGLPSAGMKEDRPLSGTHGSDRAANFWNGRRRHSPGAGAGVRVGPSQGVGVSVLVRGAGGGVPVC